MIMNKYAIIYNEQKSKHFLNDQSKFIPYMENIDIFGFSYNFNLNLVHYYGKKMNKVHVILYKLYLRNTLKIKLLGSVTYKETH